MELELGLALPNHNPMMIQGLDLNRNNTQAINDDDECQEIEEKVVRKSMHVKVKMEGVAIGRKVDLTDFDSYHAFTNTLIDMFAKYSKIERNREDYILLYLDKDGDWMLLGDAEWEEFVESVRRVQILKNDNKMGFRLLPSKT